MKNRTFVILLLIFCIVLGMAGIVETVRNKDYINLLIVLALNFINYISFSKIFKK